VDYPAGSVVDSASSTYLAVQTNGPSTAAVTPGSNSSVWVATTGINSLTAASFIDVVDTNPVATTVANDEEIFATFMPPPPYPPTPALPTTQAPGP
jgi:hypothetical protein